MKTHSNQSGFSTVELVILLVVFGLIGFVGYTVYNQNKSTDNNQTSNSTSQGATANDVKAAPAVTSTDDLDRAATALDQTDPDGSSSGDSSQLDVELNSF